MGSGEGQSRENVIRIKEQRKKKKNILEDATSEKEIKKRKERKDRKLSRTSSGLPLQLPEGQSDAIGPQHLSDADSSAIRGHPLTPTEEAPSNCNRLRHKTNL